MFLFIISGGYLNKCRDNTPDFAANTRIYWLSNACSQNFSKKAESA